MPTKRRRHSITETPPVEEALDRLRAQLGTERLELGELVVRGAEAKLVELERAERRAAERRSSLANAIREGKLTVDPKIAEEAKASWIKDEPPPLD